MVTKKGHSIFYNDERIEKREKMQKNGGIKGKGKLVKVPVVLVMVLQINKMISS